MGEQFAVITGAASGLGKAFAIELSKRKLNTILIDLPEKRLSALSERISRDYNTQSVFFEYNLTNKENVIEVTEKINAKYEVDILINNAGVGGTKSFEEADIDYINGIIQLNVMATSLMTHQLLANLKRQKKSYVLNVSSMVAFSPIGYKTVYPASKVFVHYFSRGLYQELKNSNVFVSVVNPGPMKTNEDVSKRIDAQGVFGKMGLLTPERVAEISIKKLFKRDTMIMLNYANGINWLLMKIVPIWLRLPLLTKAVRREIKTKHN